MNPNLNNLTNLNVGDKVKVIKKIPSGTNGWNDIWTDDMDNSIGKILEIKGFAQFGIKLSDSWFYPREALGKVVNGKVIGYKKPKWKIAWKD